MRWELVPSTDGYHLRPACGRFPKGWVLIRAHVRGGGSCSSRLLIRSGNGNDGVVPLDIPISRKGIALELVRLPEDVRGLTWQLRCAGRGAQLGLLAIDEVGALERIWRMLRRVVSIFLQQPRDRRRRASITLGRVLLDLQEAYHLAGLFRAHSPGLDYEEWIARFDALSAADRSAIRTHIERFGSHPRFHVFVPATDGDRRSIDATLDSLNRQLYRNFTATVLDAGGAVAAAYDPDVALPESGIGSRVIAAGRIRNVLVELSETLQQRSPADFVMVVPAGSRLAEQALYWLTAEFVACPGAVLLYADDDAMDDAGRRASPRFKPDWSPEHLRSTDYIGRASACRADEFVCAGGPGYDSVFGDGHAVLLRMTQALAADAVRHIPAVLFHRSTADGEPGEEDGESGVHALAAHLAADGLAAKVSAVRPGCYRVRYALPDPPPPVSIVVPTRDGAELLRQCVESVVARTTYPNYEVLVVDNQSAEPRALAYLAELAGRPRMRVLRWDRPFDFSAINNFAAEQAKGGVLCLLNNDTEVISPDWLEEMVGHLSQPGVGAVGAKLHYPDGRVQHAGDAVGPGGCADHLHSGLPGDAPGYCNRAIVAQEVSAVTAACLVTWRSLYRELGGLDAKDLAVSFNDVDYCLRVWESGRRVIFTPHARLYHHESATRGADASPDKQARTKREADVMRARWKARMRHDPCYNPNLSYLRPDFSLSNAPMVRRPWMKNG